MYQTVYRAAFFTMIKEHAPVQAVQPGQPEGAQQMQQPEQQQPEQQQPEQQQPEQQAVGPAEQAPAAAQQ
jgi:hypothetical protein